MTNATPAASVSRSPNDTLTVGMIGHGAIGRDIMRLVDEGSAGSVRIVGILVRDVAKHASKVDVPVVGSVKELLDLEPDVVIEGAGHDAIREHAEAILAGGVDLIALGVGALADETLLGTLERAAISGGSQLRICSGAIAALDAISSAALIGLDSVTHTVRKPPRAFLAPDEAEELQQSGGVKELYSGTAREAVGRFPENVNVVAAISLAGIGLDRTTVRVAADASVTRNTHEVEVHGTFGSLHFRIENIPSENPKTGRLVAPSVVRSLRGYNAPVVVGG